MKKLVPILALIIMLLTACQKSEPTGEDTPFPPAADFVLNPLTGLPVDPDFQARRPYAIMQNNIKAALPQFGISKADIIYELLAEGGITRLMCLYQNPTAAPQIGSVRSAREYYYDIACGHNALYVHLGGSPGYYSLQASRKVAVVDFIKGTNNAGYWRDKGRLNAGKYEHSAFTSGERIIALSDSLKINMEYPDFAPVFNFSTSASIDPTLPANNISVNFSNYKTGVFLLDQDTKRYLVSQYGEPHIDGQDGSQLATDNVFVLFAKTSSISGDDAGRIDVNVTGSGSGYYFHGGNYVEFKWSRPNATSMFEYTLDDQSPLIVAPGTSYICIIPIGNSLIIR